MRAYPSYLLLRGLGSFAGACAFTLNLVYQVRTVGLGPLQLVTVGTALEVVCLLAQLPTGVLADLYGRRLSVIVGFLLLGSGALVEGLVPTYAGVLVGTAVWGVGSTCVDGAEQAWLAGELGEDRVGPAFARGAQLSQVAAVLGIGAAVLAASVTLALPLLVGGACWLLLAAVLLAGMPERHFVPPPRRGAGPGLRDQLAGAGRVIRGTAGLLALLGAVFVLGLGSEGWDRLGPAHFLDDLAFPETGTPVLWLGRSASPRCSARCCSPKRCGGGSTRPGRGRLGCCWPASSWSGWSPRSRSPWPAASGGLPARGWWPACCARRRRRCWTPGWWRSPSRRPGQPCCR